MDKLRERRAASSSPSSSSSNHLTNPSPVSFAFRISLPKTSSAVIFPPLSAACSEPPSSSTSTHIRAAIRCTNPGISCNCNQPQNISVFTKKELQMNSDYSKKKKSNLFVGVREAKCPGMVDEENIGVFSHSFGG